MRGVVVRPKRSIRELTVFLFFSNRLGCLGSILVSIVLTLLVLWLLRLL